MVEGIDENVAAAWLGERVHEVDLPLSFSIIPGGRSNLTYEIADASGQRWILRRPPLHGLLQSAHDMGREYRIMRGLSGSGIPVPAPIGYEPNENVLGAPFYIMTFVAGPVLRGPADLPSTMTRSARRRIGGSMVEILLRLHALEPSEVGLQDLGRPYGYISRQLKTWSRQLDNRHSNGRRSRLLERVHAQLSASIPHQQATAIVHGDYRLDNMVLSPKGCIRAVLDWELCTLGDPLADVATLAVYWTDPEDDLIPLGTSATVVSGFIRRADVIEAYRIGSGLSFAVFNYYLAFANWKLAVILEGVYARFQNGAYGTAESRDWQRLDHVIPKLAARATQLL